MRLVTTTALAVAAVLPLSAQASSGAVNAAATCGPAHFAADIRHGPDRDLSLAGSLSLTLKSNGRISGTLVHYGKRLAVTGAVHRGSLELAFHLRNGRRMTGVGTAARAIRSCADVPTKG